MIFIKFSSKGKKEVFNWGLVLIIFVMINIILYNISFLSYIFRDNIIIKVVLLLFPVVGFGIGSYQLITNKLNKSVIGGRIWGGLSVVLAIELMAIICYPVSIISTSISINLTDTSKVFSNDSIKSNFNDFDYKVDCETKKINNVTYYYDNQNSRDDIKVCDDALDIARIKVDAYFPYAEYPMKVVVLEDFEKLGKSYTSNAVGLTTYPDMVIYILNSNTRMDKRRNSRKDADRDTRSTMCHEYVHFVMFKEIEKRQIFPSSDIPVWVQEGMAYYVENLNYNDFKIDTYAKMKNLKYADKEFSGENGIEYYIASSVIINHLIKNYGGNRVVMNILDDMETSKDFYKSFNKVVGKTFEEIEDEVLD